jgi:squalene-hopene/tetraprenyl-beta-curcumene cyclase
MQQLESTTLNTAAAVADHGERPGSLLSTALERASRHLLSLQRADGHWCGELEGDSILESEYLLMLHFLGHGQDERARKAARYLRQQQLPGGGWALYRGGPPDISSTVKAYFVLKLQGDSPQAPHMVAARRTILELGGLAATNTYTKTYLALFGQYSWWGCPAIPPEIILFPRWFYFDVYEMSSWSRAIFVPLSILWAKKPLAPVPPGCDLAELAGGRKPQQQEHSPRELLWRGFFRSVDLLLKLWEASRLRPLRERALARAEAWILARLEDSDGLGAIFPSVVNTIMAFRTLGYPEDHPVIARQLAELEALELDLGDTLKMQPCLSPVWDTAQSLSSLATAGVAADDPRLLAAARWLLAKEAKKPGDWRINNLDAPVSGWFFEYENEFYPDCDDTAEVLTALTRVRFPDPQEEERAAAARHRGLAWLLSMQNQDGGWAAFDRGCDKAILTLIPFADHNAMLDPSCEDITGRVLETLAEEGLPHEHPAVRRAVAFLRARQQPDGTWYGRWGVNYIYGTWLALWGLARVGEAMDDPAYQRAARWLREHQNPDGGWGESVASYDDPAHKGRGASTAAQTAWALLGLFATGDFASESVRRGVDHLLATQGEDGTWHDEQWTGTGFPRVFYLRYDYYDDYFPLLALAVYLDGPGGVCRRGRPRPASVASVISRIQALPEVER